jgi:hypothetical protein
MADNYCSVDPGSPLVKSRLLKIRPAWRQAWRAKAGGKRRAHYRRDHALRDSDHSFEKV